VVAPGGARSITLFLNNFILVKVSGAAPPNRKSTTGVALRQYWLLLAHYWHPVLAPVLAYVWDDNGI